MTREEHRIQKLKKVAQHLNAAAKELLAHTECEALRKELERTLAHYEYKYKRITKFKLKNDE